MKTRKHRTMYCRNFAGKILKNKTDYTENVLVRIRCKKWSCSYCASKNKEVWRASLIDQFNHNEHLRGWDWSFVTVTCPAWVHKIPDKTERAEASARIIKTGWNGLLSAIRKHIGQKFEYIRVVEDHADGTLHIHMLMSAQWDDIVYRKKDNEPYSRWLAQMARKHGFGFICSTRNLGIAGESEAVNTFAALLYCLKYVTKTSVNVMQLITINRIRFIQTSRGIKSPQTIRDETGTPSNWKLSLPIDVQEFYHDMQNGRRWVDGDRQLPIRIKDFENDLYPNPDS